MIYLPPLFAKPKFRRNRNSSEISSEKFFAAAQRDFVVGPEISDRNFGRKVFRRPKFRTELIRGVLPARISAITAAKQAS